MAQLTVAEIKKFLKKEDPVILEIGANTGRDSQRFLDAFSNISLFCFEPDPRCIVKFENKISDARCKLFKTAISDKDGESVFHLSIGVHGNKYYSQMRNEHGILISQHVKDMSECALEKHPRATCINSSSLSEPTGHLKKFPNIGFYKDIMVVTAKLDTWSEENSVDKIDFIWADTQGAEEKLINGGKAALSRTNYFYTEYSDKELFKEQPSFQRVVDMLPDFRVEERFTTNVLFKNRNLQ